MLPENPTDAALAFVDYCKTPGREAQFAQACELLNADSADRDAALVELAAGWGCVMDRQDAAALVESFDAEREESETGVRPNLFS